MKRINNYFVFCDTASLEKFLTFSLITSIPLSSDAFNSKTLDFINSGLH